MKCKSVATDGVKKQSANWNGCRRGLVASASSATFLRANKLTWRDGMANRKHRSDSLTYCLLLPRTPVSARSAGRFFCRSFHRIISSLAHLLSTPLHSSSSCLASALDLRLVRSASRPSPSDRAGITAQPPPPRRQCSRRCRRRRLHLRRSEASPAGR